MKRSKILLGLGILVITSCQSRKEIDLHESLERATETLEWSERIEARQAFKDYKDFINDSIAAKIYQAHKIYTSLLNNINELQSNSSLDKYSTESQKALIDSLLKFDSSYVSLTNKGFRTYNIDSLILVDISLLQDYTKEGNQDTIFFKALLQKIKLDILTGGHEGINLMRKQYTICGPKMDPFVPMIVPQNSCLSIMDTFKGSTSIVTIPDIKYTARITGVRRIGDTVFKKLNFPIDVNDLTQFGSITFPVKEKGEYEYQATFNYVDLNAHKNEMITYFHVRVN